MIEAFRTFNDEFVLRDGYPYNKSQSTWANKEKIKQAGGKWNADKKAWIIPKNGLEKLGNLVQKMYNVQIAENCHEPAQIVVATETDIQNQYVILGCSLCDIPQSCGNKVPILSVLDFDFVNS